MSNNKSSNFFKFKNVQVICRPNVGWQTWQNTQIGAQGTVEEQFTEITAAVCEKASWDIDDILTDDDSVDYSPPWQQLIEPQIQIHTAKPQLSDSDDTNINAPDSGTDSSLDTSSIEVIQPNEGLEIWLPINPLLRAPQISPKSPRTNVVVPVQDGLFTGDEEAGDQVVPPIVGATTPEPQGGWETLSPTLQVIHSVWSAIELTVKDLEPSEQWITDKWVKLIFS